MSADAITRWGLLAGYVVLLTRTIYFAHHTRMWARKIALWSIAPPAIAWIWFNAHLVATVPAIEGVLRSDIWYSRIAQFLTIVCGFVIQWVINYSERVERRVVT